MKAELPPHPFEITLPVQPADIDGQNHVNNTVYLRWVQEVATAHWESLAPATAREAIGWVVVRHEIDYKTPAVSATRSSCAPCRQATRVTSSVSRDASRHRHELLLRRAPSGVPPHTLAEDLRG